MITLGYIVITLRVMFCVLMLLVVYTWFNMDIITNLNVRCLIKGLCTEENVGTMPNKI